VVQVDDNQTNTVTIGDFESVKILTARDHQVGFGCAPNASITITKSPGAFKVSPVGAYAATAVPLYPEALTIAGPAVVAVESGGCSGHRTSATPLVVTLEISPIAYPVTNTVAVGPGQSAEINLQASTNLVQWTSATNGVYTAEQALFFRLYLRRTK
jgi:hypothetical protein